MTKWCSSTPRVRTRALIMSPKSNGWGRRNKQNEDGERPTVRWFVVDVRNAGNIIHKAVRASLRFDEQAEIAHNPGVSSNRTSRFFNTSWTLRSCHKTIISSFKAANADEGSVPLCNRRPLSCDVSGEGDVALLDLMRDFQSLLGRTQTSQCRLATTPGEIIFVRFVSIKRRGERPSRMRWRFRVLDATAAVDSHSSVKTSRILLIVLRNIRSYYFWVQGIPEYRITFSWIMAFQIGRSS